MSSIRARQLQVEIAADGVNKATHDAGKLDDSVEKIAKNTQKAAVMLDKFDNELAKLAGHDNELRRLNKWLSQEGVAKSLDETTKALLREQAALVDMQRAAKLQGDNSFFNKLKGGITSIAAPISEVIQGINVLFGWFQTIGGAVAGFAQQAIDAGSRIQDLKDQTNLGAETLSAFDFAASQTNVSIEDLTSGFKKFTLNVAEANDGSEEARKTLLRFGIDPQKAINDLDGALAKAFTTVYNIKNPVLQAQAAFELFGKSGDKVLKLIKSTNGDVASFIKQAKEMGVVISEADVAAFDALGDKAAIIGKQFQGLGITVTKHLLPTIGEWVNAFSSAVTQAKPAIESLASQTGATLKKWSDDLKDFYQSYREFEDYVQNKFPSQKGRSLLDIITAKDKIYKGFQDMGVLPSDEDLKKFEIYRKTLEQANELNAKLKSVLDQQQTINPNTQAKELTRERLRTAEMEFQSFTQIARDVLDKLNEELKKNGTAGDETLKAYNAAMKSVFDAELNLENERANLRWKEVEDVARRNEILKQLELKRAEIYSKTIKQNNDVAKAIIAANIERQKSELDLANKTDAVRTKLWEDATEKEAISQKAQLEQLKEFHDKKIISESQYVAKSLALLEKQSTGSEYLIYRRLRDAYIVSLADKAKADEAQNLDLNGNLLELAEQRLQFLKNLMDSKPTKELADAVEKLSAAIAKAKTDSAELKTNFEKAKGSVLDTLLNLPDGITMPDPNKVPDWLLTLPEGLSVDPSQITDPYEQAFDTLKGMGKETFDSLAQGVGSLIEQWVLYGSEGENSLRKMTAAILASLAAEAAVQALMELARGFAALANPFTAWKAPLHFKAAAIFGAVAGVAGLAGRAVAGNSFNQSGSSASQSSSRSSGTEISRREFSSTVQSTPDSGNDSARNREFIGHQGALVQVIRELREELSTLKTKPDGVIVKEGLRQNKGLVSATLDNELGSRQGTAKSIGRKLQLA